MNFIAFSDEQQLLLPIISLLRKNGTVDVITQGDSAKSLQNSGVRKIFLLDDSNRTDSISDLISEKMKSGEYTHAFFASTVNGRDVAGLVSGKTGIKAVAEINSLVLDGNSVRTKRFFYGGKSIVEEESDARIFTFVPGISEFSPAENASQAEKLSLKPSRINMVSVEEKNTGGVDIEKSQAIVSVGRGIGNKEGLSVVEPLAAVLNGVVAGSRPVCLDYHWLSEDRQVGLSGKKVRPKVYIALGISGQIQHIAGMRGSKIVIAVNKDKSAPIFEECDYGIVGDLFQIVPKIVEGMKK